jgi:Cdc6-like AAA superfamily ATPase
MSEIQPPTQQPPEAPRQRELHMRMVAASVFQPAAPVGRRELFVGRSTQINAAIDAVFEVGRHVAVFGERGVGKTSLANILSEILESLEKHGYIVSRVGATKDDTLESVLYRLLSEIAHTETQGKLGFKDAGEQKVESLGDILGTPSDGVSYDAALRFLRFKSSCVLILDEFDRMPETERARFTDLVKALSDAGSRATLMFVGVAESVTSLIDAHGSLGRNLAQIEMPRMSGDEIRQILAKAANIGLTFEDTVSDRVVRFSQGLPHYAHLLGLACAYECAARNVAVVSIEILDAATKKAVEGAAASIRNSYKVATSSAHKDALYAKVLLACALAVQEAEESFGEFRPADVLKPFRSIVRDGTREISTFNQHLTAFAEEDSRGRVLVRLGKERNYRFRFTDPMLPPFVIMACYERGLIPPDFL